MHALIDHAIRRPFHTLTVAVVGGIAATFLAVYLWYFVGLVMVAPFLWLWDSLVHGNLGGFLVALFLFAFVLFSVSMTKRY